MGTSIVGACVTYIQENEVAIYGSDQLRSMSLDRFIRGKKNVNDKEINRAQE